MASAQVIAAGATLGAGAAAFLLAPTHTRAHTREYAEKLVQRSLAYAAEHCKRAAQQFMASDIYRIQVCAGISAAAALWAVSILLPASVCVLLCVSALTCAIAVSLLHRRVTREGVLKLLSPATQRQLTQTSLLEWLRDDSLSRRLAPYLPLLLNLTPEEMQLYLDSAPVTVRDTLLRRGLIHALPEPVQRVILGRRAAAALSGGEAEGVGASGLRTGGEAARDAEEEESEFGGEAEVGGVTDIVMPSDVAAAQTAPLVPPPTWHTHVLSAVLRRRALQSVVHTMDTAGLTQGRLTAGAVGLSAFALLRVLNGLRSRSAATPGNAALVSAALVSWFMVLLRARASNGLEEFERLRLSKAVETLETVLRLVGGTRGLHAAAPFLQHWSRLLGVQSNALWKRMCEIAGFTSAPVPAVLSQRDGEIEHSEASASSTSMSRSPRDSWACLTPAASPRGTSAPASSAGLTQALQRFSVNGSATAGLVLLVLLAMLLRARSRM